MPNNDFILKVITKSNHLFLVTLSFFYVKLKKLKGETFLKGSSDLCEFIEIIHEKYVNFILCEAQKNYSKYIPKLLDSK